MDKNLLIQSIIEYREIGKELMNRLGRKFGLDISNEEDYLKLVWKANDEIPRNGELSKKWNYAFHGLECGFHNRETKQHIEVKLFNPPNFGVVESWFLLSFLKTTNTYKHLAENLDWQQLEKILNNLYENKEVEEIKE
jgi:hypothetical protein